MQERPQPGRWCLVTGASRGIGRAVAEAAKASGFGIVAWSRTPPEGGAGDPDGAETLWQQVDVSDPQAVAAACEVLRGRGISLAALVLNAGIGRWRPLGETARAEWRHTLSVNLDGAFNVLQAALPLLDRDGAPVVVGLLSDSALFAFPDRAAYSASKAGLRALLETARLEMRDKGVRFSLLYPSRVDTYFAGSVERGEPGLRASGLTAAQVADVVVYVLNQPPTVEIREVHLSATTDTFGPYQQRSPGG